MSLFWMVYWSTALFMICSYSYSQYKSQLRIPSVVVIIMFLLSIIPIVNVLIVVGAILVKLTNTGLTREARDSQVQEQLDLIDQYLKMDK